MAVSKDESTGLWRFSIYLTGPNGKKIRKRGNGYTTKKLALQKEQEVINEYGVYDLKNNGNSDITLKQLYDLWFKTRGQNLSHNTQMSCLTSYKYVTEYFGEDMICKDITVAQVIQFKSSIEKKYSKNSALKSRLQGISNLFNFAINLDYLTYNPFQKAIKIIATSNAQDKKEEKTIWTNEDYNKFCNSLDLTNFHQFKLYVLITLLFHTGLRINEALSLTWDRLNGNYLTIDRQAIKKGREIQFTTTKSKTSNRTIYISNNDLAILYQYKNQCRKHISFDDSYFIFGDKYPYSVQAYHKYFLSALNKVDVPKISFHNLRHSHASILLSQGMDIGYISKRLGHANISITMSIYSHYLKGKENLDNEKLENILF